MKPEINNLLFELFFAEYSSYRLYSSMNLNLNLIAHSFDNIIKL